MATSRRRAAADDSYPAEPVPVEAAPVKITAPRSILAARILQAQMGGAIIISTADLVASGLVEWAVANK